MNSETDNTDVRQQSQPQAAFTEPSKRVAFSYTVEHQSIESLNANDTNQNTSNYPSANDDETTNDCELENLYEKNLLSNLQEYPPMVPKPAVNQSEKGPSKLGTILGVLLPCVQNIFGVIFFIRISWVVGNAGLIEGFFISFICCLCTFLTSISLSAVATNGKIAGGGPYFIISRNLSPLFGSSIGLLFYVGNTVAVSMYICGACEIFLKYMFQNRVSIKGDINESSNFFWNCRFYGTIWLLTLSSLVFIGVKFVSKISPIALGCVLLSILAVFAGMIKSAFVPIDLNMCLLGDRLLITSKYVKHGIEFCTKDKYCNLKDNNSEPFLCPLYELYCPNGNKPDQPECDTYWLNNDITIRSALPGFPRAFWNNLFPGYLDVGDANPDVKGDFLKGQVIEQDTATSFLILIGIFFPSVTGILAGCNRSGDLADPSKSIPRGTLIAQIATSIVYISALIGYGVCGDRLALRDKSGLGLNNKLISAKLAWPHEWFVLIGSFFSTSGAALQSLVSAPRLLHAISKDEVIPFLRIFSPTFKGEPFRALLFTVFMSELGVLAADIDKLTPLVAMFFLLCYTFINFSCAFQSLMDAPNWRPRFKYYHWSLSIIGAIICLSVMFIASPFFAAMSWLLAILIYIYIYFKGAEKEWGDGIKGLNLSSAVYALLNLGDKEMHVKNWRPQLLLCAKIDSINENCCSQLFDFAQQLKKGKGLTIVTHVVAGEYLESLEKIQYAKQILKNLIKSYKLDGFSNVSASNNFFDGLTYQVQTCGIGQIRPNTVLLNWLSDINNESANNFMNLLKVANSNDKSVIVLKCKNYPTNKQRQEGTIDIWFILSDGGLMIQIGYLLNLHWVWRRCKLRLFTVAQPTDNSVKLKQELEKCLDLLRIKAQVKIIEMDNEQISAYAYEKTLRIMERKALLKELNLPETPLEISTSQLIIDKPRKKSDDIKLNPIDQIETESILKEKSQENENDFDNIKDFTYTATIGAQLLNSFKKQKNSNLNKKLRKMHSAVQLNEHLKNESSDAKLVIINLPTPPKISTEQNSINYLHFIEALTSNLDRVLLIRSCGKEYVTSM